MVHKVKDLSPDQRLAIESLLGRAIGENEKIIIRTADTSSAPEWLKSSWDSAQEQGLDDSPRKRSTPKLLLSEKHVASGQTLSDDPDRS